MKKIVLILSILICTNSQANMENKSIPYLSNSCNQGNMEGCYELAKKYNWFASKNNQDYHKANKLFTKACNNGFYSACTELGHNYREGFGARQNLNKSTKLYKKACANNDYNGCANLINSYKLGRGIKKNMHKAEQLSIKACDESSGQYPRSECWNLGRYYMEKNKSKAKEHYGKMCDKGWQSGCDRYRKLNEEEVK